MKYKFSKIAKLAWKRFDINQNDLNMYKDLDWYYEDFELQIKDNKYENTLQDFKKYFVILMTDSIIYQNQKITREQANDYIKEDIS